jgi:hypothetical protein
MPHGHDVNEVSFCVNLEIEMAESARHQRAPNQPAANRSVRRGRLGDVGESSERCRHLVVKEIWSRRTIFAPPVRDPASL